VSDLQKLCETGSRLLVETDYLGAERAFVDAERIAWSAQDWDTLSRVYMPLQEARRQRRQRCGEGTVKLDCLAGVQHHPLDPALLAKTYPQGQLLVADTGSITPALQLRTIAHDRKLYLETFLAAVYPVGASFVVAVVPTADVQLPPADGRGIDTLLAQLPPFCVVLSESDLPRGEQAGNDITYARTMALWERLHQPFLAAALATADPLQRMKALRQTIDVDYACEIAHQELSQTARQLTRRR
jgi:hypothetical protein